MLRGFECLWRCNPDMKNNNFLLVLLLQVPAVEGNQGSTLHDNNYVGMSLLSRPMHKGVHPNFND